MRIATSALGQLRDDIDTDVQLTSITAVEATMIRFLIASAALLPAWSAALGQDHRDIRVRVGAGAQLTPDFIGAKDRKLVPMLRISIARGTNEFGAGAPGEAFGIPLVSTGSFSFGPAVNVARGRKDSDAGLAIGDVRHTIEAGAFAQFQPAKSIRVRAELLKGIGGHDGVVASLGAYHIWRDGDRYVVSIGPRVSFSDSRYQRAFFGVTPKTAFASGLPVYRPDGGVHAVGLASGLSYQFNPRWGLLGFARYDRLVGDAAKSPIVRDLGSRNQLAGGVALSYTFTIHR